MSSGVAPSDAHPARTSHSEGPCSAAAPLAGDAAPAAPAAGSAEPAATGAAAGHKRAASGSDDSHPAPKLPKTVAAPAASAPGAAASAPGAAAAAPAPKGKAKAKPKAKPSASWVQSAKLTKQAYASTMVQAASIQGQIDSDEKWAWARSHEITSAFSDARNTVSNAMTSNRNFHDLMTADLNAAKKAANDPHVFEVEVKNFSETLDHHIKALQHECKSLLEQHAVRLKYAKGNS